MVTMSIPNLEERISWPRRDKGDAETLASASTLRESERCLYTNAAKPRGKKTQKHIKTSASTPNSAHYD